VTQSIAGSQNIHWVGIDVSKALFDVGLARYEQRFSKIPLREFPGQSFRRTEKGVSEFIAWLDEQIGTKTDSGARVVMEASGKYSLELCAWLSAIRPSLEPAIENAANTYSFMKSLGLRNKTDSIDARGLALYGLERCPGPYEPLSPERQELRELSRMRTVVVGRQTAAKNRAKDPSSSTFVRRMEKQDLKHFASQIKKIEAAMLQVIANAPSLKNDYELLLSIPGVGPITATTVLAELGDLRRFRRARQLTAFAGVSPQVSQSGTSVQRKTKMSKKGNTRARTALYLSAMAVLNTKSAILKGVYKELVLNGGKPGKVALGAIMRKQLVLMRAILISGKPYDHQWKSQHKLLPNT